MRWDQGRTVLERMLADQQLQRVPASRQQADRPFDRMRRQRNDAEYPPTNAPAITATEVREDVPKAAAIIDLAERVLDEMSPF